MGFFSRFSKGRSKNYSSSFSTYRPLRSGTKKPFEPKKKPSEQLGRGATVYRILRALKILLALTSIVFLTYLVFFTKLFEIQKIDVQGNEATVTEQSTLNKTLQEHLGKNLLTFNTRVLEAELYEEYPYLKELLVRRSLFHTLSVELETYENLANVRVEFENGSEQIYVVNELGFVSGTGTSLETLPTLVMDVTGTDMDLTKIQAPEEPSIQTTEGTSSETLPEELKTSFLMNEELIEAETLKILLKTTEDFEGKFNMQVLEIHYLKQARELHLITERYFTVWIDLTQDTNLQLAKLKKAIGNTFNIYEMDLDYIDLRISGQNGEKVIYKLKE